MTRDEAIEKIRKLLRMKRGGTPEEVATALRLAHDLAEKHNIDLDGVNPDVEQERPIGHKDSVNGARVQWECHYAGMICDDFFNVNVFQSVTEDRTKYCMRFVGTDWDTQIALYVYAFLVGHFRREWKTKRGRCRNRQAFMWGMYLGLSSKLRERQPLPVQQPGLLVVNRQLQRRQEYIETHFGKLKSSSAEPDADCGLAKYRGYGAGRQTEIRGGVKGKDDAGQIISGAKQLGYS